MLDRKCISNGIVAGAFAGIVYALFLLLGGLTEKVGTIMGIPYKLGDLMLHFIVVIVAGVVFAVILGWSVRSWWSAIFSGLLFGLAMWIVGPMTLVPILTGGGALFVKWNSTGVYESMHPLIGHLIYGFILGLSYCFLKKGKLHKLKRPKI